MNTMGGTGKPYAEPEAGAAGMIRRATATGASPMHFMLSLGSFVALWAYLALSPSEGGFFMREFVRFEIPPTRPNHSSNDVFYGLGYGFTVIWLTSFVWVSTKRASLVRGFCVAGYVLGMSLFLMGAAVGFLTEGVDVLKNLYADNGRSVFNVILIAFGTVVGVGLAFGVLAVVANGLGGARDHDQ